MSYCYKCRDKLQPTYRLNKDHLMKRIKSRSKLAFWCVRCGALRWKAGKDASYNGAEG